MKKLTASVFLVVVSSSFALVKAQDSTKIKTQDISEVIITGPMNIKKKIDQQTSSAAVINNAELTQANNQNAVQSLTGKVAGLNISQTNSSVNGTFDIKIRSSKTLTGSTTPLIVIDGVKSTAAIFQQLPSDMIESQTILKGMQAAALYGSDGVNGAIIVTTRKGTSGKKVRITLNSGVEFENIAFVPTRQKKYGQGWYGERIHVENGAWGPAYSDPAYAGQELPVGIPLYDVDGDGQISINGNNGNYPLNDITASKYFKDAPLDKDNVKNFFQTGTALTNSLTIASGDANAYSALSLTRQDREFIVMDDTSKKTTAMFKGGFKKDKWTLDGVATITSISTKQTNGDIYPTLLHTASEIDPTAWKDFNNNDRAYTWNMYYSNPYWHIKHNRANSKSTIINGTVNLSYKLNDHITISDNGSVQYVVGDGLAYRDAYSGTSEGIAGVAAITSAYSQNNSISRVIYNDFMVDFDYDLTSDLNLKFLAGFNTQENYTKITSAGGSILNIPGIYTVWNVSTPTQPYNLSNARTLFRKNGLFGNLDLAYKDYLNFNATIRGDWSSKFLNSNSSFSSDYQYWYPSFGVSFNVKNAFLKEVNPQALSRFVVKGSWTRVGGDDPIGAYSIEDTAVLGAGYPYASGPLSFVNNASPTAFDVKPQFITSVEFNLGLGFFKDRLTLDVNAFQNDTKDLITFQTTSSASGINFKRINVGQIRSRGIEIELGATPIKTSDFRWDLRASYYADTQEVLELPDGQDEVALYSAGNVGIYAIKGEKYPVIKGTGYIRDPQGRIVIDQATGDPLYSNKFIELGNANPKYVLTFNTNLKYKNWGLYASMDFRTGHKLFAESMQRLAWGGYLESSAEFDRTQGGYVIPNSVYLNSAGQYVANTSIKSGGTSYADLPSYYGGVYQNIAENFVIDATAFKVRELGINYTLGKDTAKSIGIEGLTFGVYARNPFRVFSKENKGYVDPETSVGSGSNVYGVASQSQYPTTRVIGFNTVINF
ncbi:TonB-linked outer membrane protein, SusC/RagA family [Chryseobacterium arachidis]|uniref:TonB-linked outer membrane protein, SusC/RagA family n=2 Tax=Chryseobacterium arachidis TaxID=1416778 RepID=A0A1M4ZVX9_9FLAO|nr:TonB-linked outer membrane protein, SusC/RagA family [Chryseobacterium arachidis]